MASVGPQGPTIYLNEDMNHPDVFSVYDWNPDDNQYNLYRGTVRGEDLPSHPMQAAMRIGLRAGPDPDRAAETRARQ